MSVSGSVVNLCVGYGLVVVGVGGCVPCYVLGLHSKTYTTFTMIPESSANGFPKPQENTIQRQTITRP